MSAMMVRPSFGLAVCLIALTALSFPTLAAPIERASLAPVGFQVLCARHPEICVSTPPAVIAFDATASALLNKINISVNRRIKPHNDPTVILKYEDRPTQHTATNKWSLNVSVGDCEDYALAKRVALIRSGVPAGAVRIATARTRSGIGHAVVIIKTSRGDLVLDNRTTEILRADKTDLSWLYESGHNPRLWHRYIGRAR